MVFTKSSHEMMIATPAQPGFVRAGGLLGRIWAQLAVWHARIESRRQLQTLSARSLRDIGITAEQAQLEAARPFWQG